MMEPKMMMEVAASEAEDVDEAGELDEAEKA